MSVGNIKNTNDLINKKREYAEYLQLMIDNESIKEKRIKDYKNPNKAPPVPPQYKTASERIKDLYEQEKTAIDNVKELGVDVSEARSFVLQLEQKQDGIDNLVKLNRNFPAFKKLITDNYKTKDFDANLLLNAWEGFSVNLNALTGLNSVSNSATTAYNSPSQNYQKIVSQDVMMLFKKVFLEQLIGENKLSMTDSLRTNLETCINVVVGLTLPKETIEKIDNLTPIEINQINIIAENLLSTYKLPTSNELTKKMDEINTAYETFRINEDLATNDLIIKDLIILNRYLSSFLDDTIKKKLTDYNEFINKKINGLYSTIAKEGDVSLITNIEEELPETFFKENKTKIAKIRAIMDNELYKDKNFFDLESEGIDINNKKAVENYFNQPLMTGNRLSKLITDYNKSRTSKKRQTTITTKYVGNLLDDMISNVVDISESKKNYASTLKKKDALYNSLNLNTGAWQDIFLEIMKLDVMTTLPYDEYRVINEAPRDYFDDVDELRRYIVALSIGKSPINIGVNNYLNDLYEDMTTAKPIESKPSKQREVYDELMKFNLTREQIFDDFVNPIGEYFHSQPNSIDNDLNLQYLKDILSDYDSDLKNGGDELANDNLIYSLCRYYDIDATTRGYIESKIAEYKSRKNTPQIITLPKTPPPPPKSKSEPAKKTKEAREAELKLLSKNELIEINKTLFGKGNGKKNKPELIILILNAEYPTTGSGMKKGCGKSVASRGGDLIHIDIGSHIGKNYKEASGKGFNNKNWVDKAEKNYQANGDQPYIKSRIKIGSGVVVDDEPRYQEFGKYVIHIPQLRKNILNIKYRSGSRPQYLPIVNIDDDTKDLIMTTLDTGKMSENQFNKLPEPIKDHLIKAIKGAGLETKFFKNREKLYPTDEKEERDRFNLLKGEFDAGNDNPNLIKELRALVIKFIENCIIPKKQGLEFLRQLN